MLPDLWTLHEKFFNYIKALAKMILGLTTRFVQTCPIFEPAQCETSCIVNYRLGDKVSLCPPCAPLQTISMFMIVLVTAGVYRKVTWNTWSKSRVLWLLNRFFFRVCRAWWEFNHRHDGWLRWKRDYYKRENGSTGFDVAFDVAFVLYL